MISISNALLKMIEKERNGDLVDTDLLKKIIDIFLFLSNDIYLQDSVNVRKYLEDQLIE
jgi:hypothetical protein